MSRYQLIDTVTGEIKQEALQSPTRREAKRVNACESPRVFIAKPYGYWYIINRVRHSLTDVWRTERYRKVIRRRYPQRRKRRRQAPLSEVVWALGISALLGGAIAYCKFMEAYAS